MVHAWGGEPYENIIVNDLDSTGLMMEEYHGNKPLFLVRESIDKNGNEKANLGEYQYAYLNGDEIWCRYWDRRKNEKGEYIEGYFTSTLNKLPNYDSLIKTLKSPNNAPTKFQFILIKNETGTEYKIIAGPDKQTDFEN